MGLHATVMFMSQLRPFLQMNRCHGCVIQHPSQIEHSCLMTDSEEALLFYHDEAREKTDVNDVVKTATVFAVLLASSWAIRGKPT